MGRFRDAIRLKMVPVAAIGMIAALAGCAQVEPMREPDGPDPAPPSPPAVASPAGQAPPLGLDVRYVDEDGEFRVLRVPNFPR